LYTSTLPEQNWPLLHCQSCFPTFDDDRDSQTTDERAQEVGTVDRPEIQKFAGALQGQRAKKGIFITTSDFTKDANDYAAMIDSRIVLINGTRLSNLMIDHGIGVTRATSYEVKRLDSDYFEES
jgi:restriction endonuclease Mrr